MDILIYAVIAFLVAYRLYSVLGQRGEGEPRRPPPFFVKKDNAPRPNGSGNRADNVLPLPTALTQRMQGETPPTLPVMQGPAPESLAGTLVAMQNIDKNFDERAFLKGARMAFEMVISAFVAAERQTLKNLTAPAIYQAFESALAAREAKGERHELALLHIRDADITAAKLDGNMASVTVQFASDQLKKLFDASGALQGDAKAKPQAFTDLWTFRRDLRSADPNWQIVETCAV